MSLTILPSQSDQQTQRRSDTVFYSYGPWSISTIQKKELVSQQKKVMRTILCFLVVLTLSFTLVVGKKVLSDEDWLKSTDDIQPLAEVGQLFKA